MRTSLLALGLALLCAASAAAQSARVTAPGESLLTSPSGRPVATLETAGILTAGRLQADWREVTLDGWIPASSVRTDRRDGHDLALSARDFIRADPSTSGQPLARALAGMLVSQVERRGDWVRVRRTGWVSAAAVRLVDGPVPRAAGSSIPPAVPTGSFVGPAPSATQAPASPDSPTRRIGSAGAALLGAPGRDTIARIRPLAGAEVLAQDGDWVRIRVEGWVPAAALTAGDDPAAMIADVPAATIIAYPDVFRDKVLLWSIRFIAMQRADRLRTDFPEGAPFIIARGPAPGDGLVYVAVPEELVTQVQALSPLQRIQVLARVRDGRSALTGAPILELVELRQVITP